MELEELAAKIAALESANAEQAALAEKSMFIDKYGTKFNNNEGIGMAILNEMNRRGINSAAIGADRVVQEILDQIRMEATAVLDAIKVNQAQVSDLMNQVQDIQDSVSAATGATSGDGLLDLPPEVISNTLPPNEVAGASSDVAPVPADTMAVPPVEPAPIDTAVAPGGPAPEPLPAEQSPGGPTVVSDVRAKRNLILRNKPKENMWKPGKHIVNAIKGGLV